MRLKIELIKIIPNVDSWDNRYELVIVVDGFELTRFKLDQEQDLKDIRNVIRNTADTKLFKVIESEANY